MGLVSHIPVVAQGFTVAANVITQVTIPPYDNTKEILIYNAEVANVCLIRFGDPAVVTVATMTAANSTYLAPGLSVTFAIGPVGERQEMWAGGALTNIALLLLTLTAAPATCAINVTYVQCRGYSIP